jgi:hypothetical protein
MSQTDNVIDICRPVDFMIDGRVYATTTRRQPAGALLHLAGVDPACHRLAEVRGHRVRPIRYENTDIVRIGKGTRFVSVSDRADVAP